MEKVIRWGIVGAGSIANKFARAVKNVEGAELTAIASRSEKREESLQKNMILKMFLTVMRKWQNRH